MENKDKSRKWMWWFLGIVVAFQLYFVRELLAAFALFAVVFAAIARQTWRRWRSDPQAAVMELHAKRLR